MAGIYIYQQIVKTTTEWEVETTVYPANVWLFEQLENGMFNMAISDGINTYSNLKKVMTEVGVTIKTNTDTEYVLTITTALGSFDTPNLKGPQGEQGIQGVQGEKGEQGLQGIQGIQGEKGDKGDKGDQGEQGIQGIQGEKGEQGIQGVQGIQGETGLTGQGLSYRWNGTSLQLATIAAGTDVEQWGESVNLKGEKGDQGEQGIQGGQGIQGIQGEKGDKGDKGDIGTVGVYLDAKPSEDTLTYTENDTVRNFTLGMSAIYPDTESEDGLGISFFKGKINGKAIWGQVGGGAVSLNETVMISLVSNQDESAVPDADLLGKSVHVIYGDQDKELVWQGEAMKTTVPINMTYQVVFPSDDRYKCPAQQEYFALAGNTREVNGLYYTEVVTVNVTCDDSTSAEGQQVTINETVYDVDSTGSVTSKVPFDVSYTVSVDAKSGYTSPSNVSETANSKAKTISMEYILIIYGVFIEATDGTLYQSTEWTGVKTANSIVVRKPTVAFRIALTQSSSTMKISAYSTDPLDNYMTAISDSSQAKLDMKSAENTANILKRVSSTGYAAGYCNAFTFPDRKTKGVLPALGWLQTAYDNKEAIDNCLSACGGAEMHTTTFHWTSTFKGMDSDGDRLCYVLYWSNGRVNVGILTADGRIRPFAEYN